MAYTKYSLTPANNTAAPPDGAPEGMLPSAVNDTMRDMMSQIRDVGDGVRDGTYTMTAPKITGGTITGVAITSSTGSFTTLSTSSTTTLSGLTASTALALDASKNVVSVTNTGTGSNVLSASPTLTGTIAGASLSLSSLTSGRVTYAGASGLLTDSANLLYSGTDLTVYGLTVGRGAGAVATNTVLGASALAFNSTGTLNIAIGANANKTTTGSNNIGIGQYTLGGNAAGATGSSNTGVGDYTMFQLTSGASNVAIGQSSQQFTSTGSFNVSVGNSALLNNSTASNNTAVGYQAGYSNTTGSLTTVGYLAGYSNSTGTDNASFGSFSLRYTTTGAGNSGYGAYSLTNNTTGSSNTALGMQALQANTTASNNTAVGYQALTANTTGGATAIGWQSGSSQTTGSNNTYVGQQAGNVITTGSGCLYVGYQAQASSASVNSEVVLGASLTGKGATTSFIQGQAYNSSNTSTWSTTSDRRLKKNIVDNNTGLDKITAIQVRNFEYRLPEEITEVPQDQAIKKEGVQLGVIAQELQQVLPECVKTESTGVMTVDADNLTWYMINAIKELKQEVDSLKQQLASR